MLISSSALRIFAFLVAAALALSPSASRSQTTDHMIRMLQILKNDSGSCTFRLEAAGTISASYNTNSEFIVLWIYMLAGCDGGNNWVASADAFYVKQPLKGAALVKKIPLNKTVVDHTTFSRVKNVSFKAQADALTSYVEIDGLSMGDDDARCCPTDGRQVKLWIEDGKIRSAIVKTWKEPN